MTPKELLKSEPKWERHNALSRPAGFAVQARDFDWLKKNIPCQAACPAGTDIPGYLDAIAHGEYEKAYRINLRDNVFPAVLGRVCTRPCEPACRHGWEGLGEPVAICFSKRSTDDFMRRGEPVRLDPIYPASGKKVAVVGAGAAGLSVARELALWGHRTTVYERSEEPGGLMVLGIPPFRLPRDILRREVEQIRLCGVDILCNVEVGKDITLEQLRAEHDALVIATGTLRPFMPDTPGSDLEGVRHGLPFLMEVNHSGSGSVGDRVVVIGGGFTAVDCARTAKRLGASAVSIYYRRSVGEMYITPHEIDEMKHEGIGFESMVSPKTYLGEAGKLTAVRFVRTELGEADDSGRRRPVEIAGSEFEVPADSVLLGTGQVHDTEWVDRSLTGQLLDEQGRPRSGLGAATALDGLFITGDFASGAESLIAAIGHAKACAREVDLFLVGHDRFVDVARVEDVEDTGRTREMDELPRQPMNTIDLGDRNLTAEVETGLTESQSKTEAQRCYLCNLKFEIDNDLCIYCDRCLKVKPMENCIVKVSALDYDDADRIKGYVRSKSSRDYNLLYIDQSECIRCGACAEVCPVECISLQRVSKDVVTREALNEALGR